MKKITVLAVVSLMMLGQAFPKHKSSVSNTADTLQNGNNDDTMGNKLKIKVGSATFTATLINNETATAFKAILPI